MHRRSLTIGLLLIALALPLSASQFVELPFDQIASEAQYIVRGHIVETYAAWDDSHEIIYTYATVRVSRYFGETAGPDTLVVREVGGTVDGYTQEAIGFPMIRRGEEVVLMLTQWEESADYRIHAFNQGKFLVRQRGGLDVVLPDAVHQGDERLTPQPGHGRELDVKANAISADTPALSMDEFAQMVSDARAGRTARNTVLQRD
ncbi:MAG TPA: hypothetical protein VF787_13800 [Thermoanaerobaculia bacterium]